MLDALPGYLALVPIDEQLLHELGPVRVGFVLVVVRAKCCQDYNSLCRYLIQKCRRLPIGLYSKLVQVIGQPVN